MVIGEHGLPNDYFTKVENTPSSTAPASPSDMTDVHKEKRSPRYLTYFDNIIFTPITTEDALQLVTPETIKTQEDQEKMDKIREKDRVFRELYSPEYLATIIQPLPEENTPPYDCVLVEETKVHEKLDAVLKSNVLAGDELFHFKDLRERLSNSWDKKTKIEAIFTLLPDNKARFSYLKEIRGKKNGLTLEETANIANKYGFYEYLEAPEITRDFLFDIFSKIKTFSPPTPPSNR